MAFEPKITAKGTELPIMDLRGKPYLQVAHRLVWFREEQPTASIDTYLLREGDNYAVFKAVIMDKDGNLLATGHKREDAKSFPDYIEKAETGAIGRALAACGYGTQFDPSFDEGDRLADSPIAIPTKSQPKKEASKNSSNGSKTNTAAPVTTKDKSIDTKPTTPPIPVKVETSNLGTKEPKGLVLEVFKNLEEAGKIDGPTFKTKYLANTPFSQLTPEGAQLALDKLRTDYKELGL